MLDKQQEIANYERILSQYRGRWWDQGNRHLDELKRQLREMQDLPA